MAAAKKLPVLVTGANAGIGLAIVKALVARPEKYHVFLCCRDTSKGQAAFESLPKDTPGTAEMLQLDVTSQADIAAAAKTLQSRCHDGLHALVNNAGVGIDLPFAQAATSPSIARDTLGPNYHGALAVTEALLPQLQEGGRIVNISSGAGPQNMDKMSAERREELMREDITEADVTAHVERFTAAFEAAAAAPGAVLPAMSSDGYWLQAYGFSKAALNAWTRALARGRGKHLQVNACSPGFVRTAMTQKYNPETVLRTPEEGADTPVWLVCDNAEGLTGGFFGNNHEQRGWIGY